MSTAPDLYARILAFPIDEGTPGLSFEHRLARENGWTVTFARRVVLEYRRFVYLAMTAGHEVTPSDQVDQAWHLHLTYSRSYWERMCGELLGRPLHHGPTRGGSAEATRFDRQYEQTLAAYRTAFGEEPPADIWPPAAVRFGDDLHFVRVSSVHNWVVPKGAVTRGAALCGVAGLVAVCATGCGAAANPFALRGTDFLWFFIPLSLMALAVGLWVRHELRGPGERPGEEPELDWADAAYLAGGKHRLAAAAIARLVTAGHVRVSEDGKWLQPQGRSPLVLNSAEAAACDMLPLARTRTALAALANEVESAFAARALVLRADGHLLPWWRAVFAAVASSLPLATVAVLVGGPRFDHAVQNNLPRGILGTTMLLTFFVCLALFLSSLKRRLTRRGSCALDRLRARADCAVVGPPTPDAVGWSVAVFGDSSLVACDAAELAALAAWYPRSAASDGGGGDTGCGAGGGGGCGGGGCGGCGGCGG